MNEMSDFSRRQLLSIAAAAGTAMAIPSWVYALGDHTDPEVRKALDATIGIDMHNHVYPAGSEPHMQGPGGPPPNRGGQGMGNNLAGAQRGGGFPGGGLPGGGFPGGGQRGQRQRQDRPAETELHLADEIKKSGLTAVCASYVLDFAQNNEPGDALKNYLGWLTIMDEQLKKGHMQRALNLKDLQDAHQKKQPTIVQTVEGAQFIEGDLDHIGLVYKRGLRHLQLLHMKDDAVAPLGDVVTAQPHLGGLTEFGAKVIQECNRTGILVDMAHATTETIAGALKVATKPILYSHTGLDTQLGSNPRMAEMMKPHLISKEHAKAIADAGGVVGVWTKIADSPKNFVINIKAMVDAIGIDHVGIGTDDDLLSTRTGSGLNRNWAKMPSGFFNTVVAEMVAQGFTVDEISKVGGGNYCRLFEASTAGR